MLLVRSKELKNSNKTRSLNSRLAGFLSISTASIPQFAMAEESTSSLSSTSSLISVFLSLMVVIAIIFALAYIVRRFNVAQAGNGQLRVVASMMAGSKEKVMVIEVGDEQHLLGITSHNINHLATLEKKLSKENNRAPLADNDCSQPPANNFQQKLVHAMAQAISGKSTKDKDSANTQGANNV